MTWPGVWNPPANCSCGHAPHQGICTATVYSKGGDRRCQCERSPEMERCGHGMLQGSVKSGPGGATNTVIPSLTTTVKES